MSKQILASLFFLFISIFLFGQVEVDEINFVRQASQRLIFEENQSLQLSVLDPSSVVGQASMHPITNHGQDQALIKFENQRLNIESETETATSIWFGGFNPFATYTIDIKEGLGEGQLGIEFSSPERDEEFRVLVEYSDSLIVDVILDIRKDGASILDSSILILDSENQNLQGEVILQMLGSGLTLYHRSNGLPIVIGQADFNHYLDLRRKDCIANFQSHLFVRNITAGKLVIKSVNAALSTGIGLADIRAISYENGDPFIEQGRLWYTMSIRGRALPHHIQGVFSMSPSLFDVTFEGVIVFDRNDGLLRNEIASHLFYDRKDKKWKGMTTGFSAYARPSVEKKQLLVVESEIDPRFGFSIMKASPFGVVGDIEDPHIIFDEEAQKWRMLTCENMNGYKAIVMESDFWNKDYQRISGPVSHNSTGTSIQKIGGVYYCFSGSSERKIWIYSYPDLDEIGTLKMDLPPWDDSSRTRVWPNVVELPDGYPFKYVALMMDRYNYPGLKGPNWSYGALYLYHGSE